MRTIVAVVVLTLIVGCNRGPGPRPSNQLAAAGDVDPRNAAGSNGVAAGGVVTRRVWSGPEWVDVLGSPSPDGRYISFTNWQTGDIAVRDVVEGQSRPVTSKGSWEQSDEHGEMPVFSPDGLRLAYAWFKDNSYELRVIESDGKGERTLLRNPAAGAFIWPHAWTPDDKWIAAVVTSADGNALVSLISAEDGTVRMLKSLGWRHPLGMDVSSDGRYLAYDAPSDVKSPSRDIHILALNGSRESRVTSTPDDERLIGWSPDGESLFVLSIEAGSENIVRIPVRDGKRSGGPVLVRANVWNAWPMGFSRNALFYGVFTSEPKVYTATLDLANGQVVTQPVAVGRVARERGRAPTWSPDGAYLAYAVGPPGPNVRSIVIRSMQTGESRELITRINYISQLSWAPDGRSLYASGWTRGRRGVFRIDLQTVEARPVTFRGGGSAHVLSPDGKSLFFVGASPEVGEADYGIFARDLESGDERLIAALKPQDNHLAISPDGNRLAFTIERHQNTPAALAVLPISGGEPRVVYRPTTPGGFRAGGTQWTPDARHLLFVRGSPADSTHTLFGIPVAGGEPRPLLAIQETLWSVRLHPDGRRIAFNAGTDKAEVWVMEKF